jgi:hypothetical protein
MDFIDTMDFSKKTNTMKGVTYTVWADYATLTIHTEDSRGRANTAKVENREILYTTYARVLNSIGFSCFEGKITKREEF